MGKASGIFSFQSLRTSVESGFWVGVGIKDYGKLVTGEIRMRKQMQE